MVGYILCEFWLPRVFVFNCLRYFIMKRMRFLPVILSFFIMAFCAPTASQARSALSVNIETALNEIIADSSLIKKVHHSHCYHRRRYCRKRYGYGRRYRWCVKEYGCRLYPPYNRCKRAHYTCLRHHGYAYYRYTRCLRWHGCKLKPYWYKKGYRHHHHRHNHGHGIW